MLKLIQFLMGVLLISFGIINVSKAEDIDVIKPAVTVVSYPAPSDPTNIRKAYELKVLELALEHTREDYGDYEIQTYARSSWARMMRDLKSHSRPNDLHVLGYSSKKKSLQTLTYVKFPVHLGVLGYRVCFVSEQAKEAFSNVRRLQDLKTFSHGQGKGWVDSSVLKHNKLKVVEFEGAPRLIRMTAKNEVQTFCRGISEIKEEFEENSRLRGLVVDADVALYYPHLRFFYTHKNNAALVERLDKGLHLAYEDGSLLRLFLNTHKESLEFSNMSSRHVIALENPFLKGVDFDYSGYILRFNDRPIL